MQPVAFGVDASCERWVSKAFRALCLCVGVLLISLPVFSQGNAGRILGVVTDQSGGAVAGATVTVTDTDRGIARTLVTDDSGAYAAPNLTPSTYTVRAEAKGFKVVQRQNILLETGGEIKVDLQLQPGEVTQTVTVTEALPMVETSNAEMGGTLQSEIVQQLPMNGRNFSNLLQLRPGVTIYPGGSGWTQSTNGMRAHDNVYMVDGINGSDPWMSQAVWDSVMASGDSGTLISIDAIDEFKTEENPRAEYGWKPGGIVNVGIKSGTNSMHGTAYAYGRDGSWDARNFFNTTGFTGGKSVTPPTIALEQFGATLGGPIKKDKLFYFVTYEDQRYSVGSSTLYNSPITASGAALTALGAGASPTNSLILACLAAMGNGGVGSGNAGALTHLSASLAGLSNTCTPLPNYPGLWPVNGGSNLTSIPSGQPNVNRIDSGLGKVNYHLNDKNSISSLYYISPGSGVLNDSPTQSNPVWLTNQYARSMASATNWTYTPNASWVNEVRVGYSHYYQSFLSQDAGQNPANYSFGGSTYSIFTGQGNSFYGGFPGLSLSSIGGPNGSNAALGASWPKIVGPDGVLQVTDHISWLRGKHAFMFGGEILNNQSDSNVTSNAKGPIRFANLTDFFEGYPDGLKSPGLANTSGKGSASILTGNLLRHFAYSGYAAFIQDDWRIKPRLTLNLGLRYEINTVPVERNNSQGNFDPNAAFGVDQVGSGATSPYNGDHNNFGPRLGFAWDMFGSGRTVLRGGGGILYEQLSLDVLNGIGNSFGLRTAPTGLTVCSGFVSGGSAGTCAQTPGNIGVVNIAFANTPVLFGTGCVTPTGLPNTPQGGNGLCPGGIPYNWANNSSSTPLYNYVPYCGDGVTPVPAGLPNAGYKPAQCNVMGVARNLRTPYVEEWTLDLQHSITHNVSIDIGYVGNHGVKLLSALEDNQPLAQTITIPAGQDNLTAPLTVTAGPGWTTNNTSTGTLDACLLSGSCSPSTTAERLARPFATKFPYFKYIDVFGNNDVSNYNSMQAVLTARNYHGLTLTGGYTFSHALAEASDQGTGGGNSIPINSYGNFRSQLYAATNFDIRHRGTISATYAIPGRKGFGQVLEGWSVNAVAILQSGLPFGFADATTDFAGTGEYTGNTAANQGGKWDFVGNAADFNATKALELSGYPYVIGACTPTTANPTPCALAPGLLVASPTANPTCNAAAKAAGPLSVASLSLLGCYAVGSSVMIPAPFGGYGTMTNNMFYDEGFRNLDLSITKAFKFKERLTAQFRAEFFNILNHPDVVNPAGGPGGGGGILDPSNAGPAGSALAQESATPDQAGSNPVLGSGGSRAIQLGLKLSF